MTMAKKFIVNPKRSVAARMKGTATRRAKKLLIPGYGKKGMGWIRDPKRAAYNRAYRKPLFRILNLLSKS